MRTRTILIPSGLANLLAPVMHRHVGRIVVLTTILGMAAVVSAEGQGTAPPELVRAEYAETDDGSSPRRSLDAYAKRAEAVKFKTRYKGKSAKARGRYAGNPNNEGSPRKPWELVRRDGGRQVLRLIHKSLDDRSRATVKVVMVGAGEREVAPVTFKLADCRQEPPFYPLSCEAKP